MTKINEIESFAFPSSTKPKKKDNLWLRVLVVAIIGIACAVAFLVSHPVKAAEKPAQIRDCMTNKCICDILKSEGFHDYFSRYSPNSESKDSVIDGCGPLDGKD